MTLESIFALINGMIFAGNFPCRAFVNFEAHEMVKYSFVSIVPYQKLSVSNHRRASWLATVYISCIHEPNFIITFITNAFY